MNKKLISLAIAGAVATPFTAQAGSFMVGNQDITVSGGITGAYIYSSENATGNSNQDVFAVPDALVDFSSAAKSGGMGFTLGLGTLGENSLAHNGALTVAGGTGATTSVGVKYGWVSVMPVDGLTVDAGILATNVGYEVSPTYNNANMLLGLVWNAQPTYYTGARVTYSMNGMSVYGEVNKPSGAALGASGTFGPVKTAINFFNTANSGSIVDIIVSGSAGPVDLAANIDYIMKAKAAKTTGTDDNAIGAAFYVSVKPMDKVVLPMRLEYINDGTSGLYGLGGAGKSNTAITFTITPTYNFTDSTFVRGELAYVSTDKKGPYVDDKGAIKDTGYVVGAQGGVRF